MPGGYDSGVFGPPGGDLNGKPFLLVIEVDDNKGTESFYDDGSSLIGEFPNSPMTAILSINGRSISIAENPTTYLADDFFKISSSVVRGTSYSSYSGGSFFVSHGMLDQYKDNVNNIKVQMIYSSVVSIRTDSAPEIDWRTPLSSAGLNASGLFHWFQVPLDYIKPYLLPEIHVDLGFTITSVSCSGSSSSQLNLTKNLGTSPNCPDACDGNPINSAIGNKLQTETDFVAASHTQLNLSRYYNSQDTTASAFGANWHSTWHRGLNATGNTVSVTRPNGRQDTFTFNGTNWAADPDVTNTLTGNAQSGWFLVTADDTTEKYSTDGRLLSLTTRAGLVTNLTYDINKRLTTVTGPFGHVLKFEPTASGNVSKMTTPDNKVYTYSYDANNNLTTVTYPDGTLRQYLYENTSFPHALTGIIDEKGSRYATYVYDSNGRAVSSQHAGGVELTSITYNDNGTASVTDPRGHVHSYDFTTQFGLVKPTAVTGAPAPTLGGKAFTYDDNGFVASRTDFNDNLTTYTHDARGLETSRTEAAGTDLERTIQTTWHPTLHLPTQITEPKRTTNFSYDANGNLLTKTLTAGAATRTWSYTYNAKGQVTKVDGPRTDVADITQFGYDAQGNLTSFTNALGQVTQITAYEANSRPLSFNNPNGLVTTLTYDPRGRINTRTVGTETTTYAYDPVGNLIQVTQPDGSFFAYSYDAAHRLTGVSDALGNRLAYSLDAASNRTQEQALTAANAVARTRSYAYDQVNRLIQSLGAQGQTTAYAYDQNSNLTSLTDPLNAVTQYDYDTLNRLAGMLDPNYGSTDYTYDANDHLTSVTDPRNLTTSYAWDGLDNPLSVTSPDTGTTNKIYDAAGNLISATDARGKTTTYSYDALNRLTQEKFADGQTITRQYDQGANGLGHLTTLLDPTGSFTWTYNQQGRPLTRQQTTNGIKLTTSYSYDAAGRLATLTYPSGKTLAYSYDAAGRMIGIARGALSLLSQISYTPFGPATGWLEGNGKSYLRTLDQDGRILGIDFGGASLTAIDLDYDAADRIQGMTETGLPFKSFDYDALGRLTDYASGADWVAYDYDANGNRLETSTPAGTTTYSYAATSNRLTGLSGLIPTTKALATSNYVYDARGRLTQATVNGVTTNYGLNGLGQRVSKSGATTTLFVYDEAGHLLGEYNAAGQPIQETVWFGDTPVAVLTGGGTYYVNANHIDSPHVITNGSGQPVWGWDPIAFGDNPPNQNPSGLGTFVYNLRFPGQYYDAETGLHYNMARDYNPALGRYVQSDPIGLEGGINTYGYVGGNPISSFDLLGTNNNIPTITIHPMRQQNSNVGSEGKAGLVSSASDCPWYRKSLDWFRDKLYDISKDVILGETGGHAVDTTYNIANQVTQNPQAYANAYNNSQDYYSGRMNWTANEIMRRAEAQKNLNWNPEVPRPGFLQRMWGCITGFEDLCHPRY